MIELDNSTGWINTYSTEIDLFNPTAEMIKLEDIIHGLAHNPHFNGQSPKFFSIAQHSMLVFSLINNEVENPNSDLLLAALLHDAAEAYVGDVISPIKKHLPFFKELEDKILKVIFQKFGLDIELMKEVKPFDLMAQDIELNQFYNKGNSDWIEEYWLPDTALLMFRHVLKTVMLSRE